MKSTLSLVLAAIMLTMVSFAAYGQDAEPVILITNANVFDGVNEQLIQGADVLVEGHLIKQIAENIDAPSGAEVIDAGGRTSIPGLIDAHWHSTYAAIPVSIMMTGDMSELAIIGFLEAEKTLMRGFTSVRDMGGNPFAIKKLTDSGAHPGPRVFPSGPPISQTSGHFDFGMKTPSMIWMCRNQGAGAERPLLPYQGARSA